eukprot:Sdes_comp8900_c0_seq2m300
MSLAEFVCDIEGCKDRFTNADQLSRHLSSHMNSCGQNPNNDGRLLFPEQTPTPTRFMDGGSQEFESMNPFEQSFASKQRLYRQRNPGFMDQFQIPISSHMLSPGLSSPNSKTESQHSPLSNSSQAESFTYDSAASQVGYIQGKNEGLSHSQYSDSMDDKSRPRRDLIGSLPAPLPNENVKKLIKRLKVLYPDITEQEIKEVKRQKFLERNRAAASRCRMKKKVEVSSLEGRYKQLNANNA